MLKPIIALLFLAFAPCAALADALPPRREMNEFQSLLVGIWLESKPENIYGAGHVRARRVMMVGTETLVIASLEGVSSANEFEARAVSGTWTAKRVSQNEIAITVRQGKGRSTELKVRLTGKDTLVLSDKGELLWYARLQRAGPSPVLPKEREYGPGQNDSAPY